MSVLPDAQPFQKCSRATINPDLGVSNHGASSMKITFLFDFFDFSNFFLSSANASIQFFTVFSDPPK
jgi:hypothetical protein